ncbi:MAG: hypothetical protein V1834_04890, partial [Candidatus Micrarchaeota archaeon]
PNANEIAGLPFDVVGNLGTDGSGIWACSGANYCASTTTAEAAWQQKVGSFVQGTVSKLERLTTQANYNLNQQVFDTAYKATVQDMMDLYAECGPEALADWQAECEPDAVDTSTMDSDDAFWGAFQQSACDSSYFDAFNHIEDQGINAFNTHQQRMRSLAAPYYGTRAATPEVLHFDFVYYMFTAINKAGSEGGTFVKSIYGQPTYSYGGSSFMNPNDFVSWGEGGISVSGGLFGDLTNDYRTPFSNQQASFNGYYDYTGAFYPYYYVADGAVQQVQQGEVNLFTMNKYSFNEPDEDDTLAHNAFAAIEEWRGQAVGASFEDSGKLQISAAVSTIAGDFNSIEIGDSTLAFSFAPVLDDQGAPMDQPLCEDAVLGVLHYLMDDSQALPEAFSSEEFDWGQVGNSLSFSCFDYVPSEGSGVPPEVELAIESVSTFAQLLPPCAETNAFGFLIAPADSTGDCGDWPSHSSWSSSDTACLFVNRQENYCDLAFTFSESSSFGSTPPAALVAVEAAYFPIYTQCYTDPARSVEWDRWPAAGKCAIVKVVFNKPLGALNTKMYHLTVNGLTNDFCRYITTCSVATTRGSPDVSFP